MELQELVEDLPLLCGHHRADEQHLGHQVQPQGQGEHRQDEGLRCGVQSSVQSGCFGSPAGEQDSVNALKKFLEGFLT